MSEAEENCEEGMIANMYKFIAGISIGVLIIYTIIVKQGYRYNIGKYCRFGNVRENFIFANRLSVKRHICSV